MFLIFRNNVNISILMIISYIHYRSVYHFKQWRMTMHKSILERIICYMLGNRQRSSSESANYRLILGLNRLELQENGTKCIKIASGYIFQPSIWKWLGGKLVVMIVLAIQFHGWRRRTWSLLRMVVGKQCRGNEADMHDGEKELVTITMCRCLHERCIYVSP